MPRSCREVWGLGLIWSTLFCCASGHAQAPAVVVDPSACTLVAQDEVMRITRVELGERLVSAEDPRSAQALRVQVSCEAEAAHLTLSQGTTSESRDISLTGVDSAALPRLLALGVAELVSDWRPPALPSPAPSAPAAGPPSEPAGPTKGRARPYRLFIGALGRALFGGDVRLGGAHARVEREALGLLSFTLGMDFARGSRPVALGELTLRQWALAPSVCGRQVMGRLRALACLGVRTSVMQASGKATNEQQARGDSFWDLNAGVVPALLVDVALGPHVLLWGSIDAERMLHGIEVQTEGRASRRIGPWSVQAALGMGWWI